MSCLTILLFFCFGNLLIPTAEMVEAIDNKHRVCDVCGGDCDDGDDGGDGEDEASTFLYILHIYISPSPFLLLSPLLLTIVRPW